VILLRLTGDDPDADIARMIAVVGMRDDWSGQFVVATNGQIRIRALP